MNKQIQTDIQQTLARLYTQVMAESCHNIKIARVQLFDVKSLCVCLFEARTLFPSCNSEDVVSLCLRLGLLSKRAEKLHYEYCDILDEAVSAMCDKVRGDFSNASDFYQCLLSCEFKKEGNELILTSAKTQRDATGSYYTPADFARMVAHESFENLESFDAKNDSYVDFSCGAGDFLVAAFDVLIEKGVSPKEAFGCFWAYDIDPCALMIAVLELVKKSGLDPAALDVDALSRRVHLGNPLIVHGNQAQISPEERIELYAQGLLYDKKMGLPSSAFLKEGFTVILGNPPWEKVRFEERKYFRLLEPDVGAMSNKALRREEINRLRSCDTTGAVGLYDELSKSYANVRNVIEDSGIEIPAGELNTYSLFTLHALMHAKTDGCVALILKSAIATSPINSKLFASFLDHEYIDALYLCDNSMGVFPIDRRERFCVAIFTNRSNGKSFQVSFGNRDFSKGCNSRITVSKDDLLVLNPGTGLLPDLASAEEYDALLAVQRSMPCFRDVYPDCHFGRLVHLTSHSAFIEKEAGVGLLPVFEGKFIGQHDLRFSTFADMPMSSVYAPKASARIMSENEKLVSPSKARYFINAEFWSQISSNYTENLMLCWRSLTSSTNSRTTLAALSPFVPACQSVQFLQHPDTEVLIILAGLFNSKVFDYFVRRKIPGIDLTQSVISQVPVPPAGAYESVISFNGFEDTLKNHIINRVLSLYGNENMLLQDIARAGVIAVPVNKNRESILAELDSLFYECYGLTASQVAVIENDFL